MIGVLLEDELAVCVCSDSEELAGSFLSLGVLNEDPLEISPGKDFTAGLFRLCGLNGASEATPTLRESLLLDLLRFSCPPLLLLPLQLLSELILFVRGLGMGGSRYAAVDAVVVPAL